jgi:hypothetical protein
MLKIKRRVMYYGDRSKEADFNLRISGLAIVGQSKQ